MVLCANQAYLGFGGDPKAFEYVGIVKCIGFKVQCLCSAVLLRWSGWPVQMPLWGGFRWRFSRHVQPLGVCPPGQTGPEHAAGTKYLIWPEKTLVVNVAARRYIRITLLKLLSP